MQNLPIKIALVLSAATFLSIGVFITFFPAYLFSLNGLSLDPSAAMMSDIRAPGVPILLAGAITLLGLFNRAFERPALLASASLMLAYGAGRLISISLDGVPPASLLIAMAIEFGLGAWCGWLFGKTAISSKIPA
ncbi:MAG: DUF4345 domain-containing protein [Pseudomonadota bacterium]